MPTASVSEEFALIDGRETTAAQVAWVNFILGTSRSRMQLPIAGSTRARSG